MLGNDSGEVRSDAESARDHLSLNEMKGVALSEKEFCRHTIPFRSPARRQRCRV
jgi:hypothetical protein